MILTVKMHQKIPITILIQILIMHHIQQVPYLGHHLKKDPLSQMDLLGSLRTVLKNRPKAPAFKINQNEGVVVEETKECLHLPLNRLGIHLEKQESSPPAFIDLVLEQIFPGVLC